MHTLYTFTKRNKSPPTHKKKLTDMLALYCEKPISVIFWCDDRVLDNAVTLQGSFNVGQEYLTARCSS